MSDIPKMMVKHEACEVGLSTLDRSLKDLCTFFEELRARYGDNAKFIHGHYDEYDNDVSFMVYTTREETDAEYAARMSRIAESQEAERQLFLKLREKYDPLK